MRIARLLLAPMLVTGCADLAAFRVIEYDGNALIGRAGGCVVHYADKLPVFAFEYHGQRCTVRVAP